MEQPKRGAAEWKPVLRRPTATPVEAGPGGVRRKGGFHHPGRLAIAVKRRADEEAVMAQSPGMLAEGGGGKEGEEERDETSLALCALGEWGSLPAGVEGHVLDFTAVRDVPHVTAVSRAFAAAFEEDGHCCEGDPTEGHRCTCGAARGRWRVLALARFPFIEHERWRLDMHPGIPWFVRNPESIPSSFRERLLFKGECEASLRLQQWFEPVRRLCEDGAMMSSGGQPAVVRSVLRQARQALARPAPAPVPTATAAPVEVYMLKGGSDTAVRRLHAASYIGDAAMVQRLLEAGVDKDAKDKKYGVTALILASMEGHADIVRLLLEVGADARARGNDGFTARYFVTTQRTPAELAGRPANPEIEALLDATGELVAPAADAAGHFEQFRAEAQTDVVNLFAFYLKMHARAYSPRCIFTQLERALLALQIDGSRWAHDSIWQFDETEAQMFFHPVSEYAHARAARWIAGDD